MYVYVLNYSNCIGGKSMLRRSNHMMKRITAFALIALMLLCLAPFSTLPTQAQESDLLKLTPPNHHKIAEDNGDGTYDLTLDVHGVRHSDTNVVVVLDVSTSIVKNTMQNASGQTVTALEVLKDTAIDFVNEMFASSAYAKDNDGVVNISIVRYAGSAEIIQMWTDDQATLVNTLRNLKSTGLEGNTNCQSGLTLAARLFENDAILGYNTNRPANLNTAQNFVVFMTDGAPNRAYIADGSQTLTHFSSSYSLVSDSNVDQVSATYTTPGVKVVSGTTISTGGTLSRGASGTDYRKVAAEAALWQAKLLYESPYDITTLTVGLGEWFTQEIEDSTFPTAVHFTRLVGAVGNGIITYEEAVAQLGADVGSGAMPNTNPPYPIIDTVNGVYLGDSYYNRFKSGSTYTLDNFRKSLTLAQLKAAITEYYGDVATQMQDGIYRFTPVVRQDESIDITEVTEPYSFFGNTQAAFADAFQSIANTIQTGYVSVDIVDLLSKNVTLYHQLTAEEIASALTATYPASFGGATVNELYNPEFLSISFYVNINDADTGNVSTDPNDYILDANPPTTDEYDVKYIWTNEACKHEGIMLMFHTDYMLRHNHMARIRVTVKPSQYAIDTLYANQNNASFTPIAFPESARLTQADGIDPNGVGTADTNGYPDQAFDITYQTTADGYTVYDSSYYADVASRLYGDTAQYGFFTNTYTQAYVRYRLTNVDIISHEQITSTRNLYANYSMPVIAPTLVDLPVTKIWNGSATPQPIDVTVSWQQNQYAATITEGVKHLTITGTTTETRTVRLDASNNWQSTFVGLPQGHTFTVTETDANGAALNGYAVTYALAANADAGRVTITGDALSISDPCINDDLGGGLLLYNTPLLNKTVTKVWADNGNTANRPASVTIQLFANGEACGDPVVMTAPVGGGDTWTYTYTNLPATDLHGDAIVYAVTETSELNTVVDANGDPVSHYTSTVDQTTLTITNTDPGVLTDLTVTKVWDDANDQDGLRPASIAVQLYANGVAEGNPVTLNAANHWTYQWQGLASNANNVPVVYTAAETATYTGYTAETPVRVGNYLTFTNVHVPETTQISVQKVWSDGNNQDGLRPASIECALLANGAAVAHGTVTLSAANSWSATFTDLPTQNGGTPIVYTIAELSVPNGYTSVITGTAATGFVVTNTHTPYTTERTAVKVWNDGGDTASRTSSVSVQLYADGTASGSAVTLSDANNWTTTWSNLPLRANARNIVYTVREVSVPAGYGAEIVTSNGTTTIYNTPIVSRTVQKVWSDNSNADGYRPDAVYVQLTRNGDVYLGAVRLSSANSWTYTFTDLPAYDPDGVAYVYSATEINYTNQAYYATSVSISGTTITLTNTQSRGDITLDVNKSWVTAETFPYYADFDILRTVNVTENNVTTTTEDREYYDSVRLTGAEATPYHVSVSLMAWETIGDATYRYTYDVEETAVGAISGGSEYYALFNGPMTEDARFVQELSKVNDSYLFTNHTLLSTIGAQAHMIHETQSCNTAPLYTDGIRFGSDIDIVALDAALNVGDRFVYGVMMYPKTLLDANVPTDTPTAETASSYLMRLAIQNHAWQVTTPTSVVYATCVGSKSTALNADTMVTWTQAMEDAANARDIDALIPLMRAADCSIFKRVSDVSFRYVVYLMFDKTDAAKRQRQADTVLTYRAFFIKQSADSTVETTLYTMQRQNCATNIFNYYNYLHFVDGYDTILDPLGMIARGTSVYFPTADVQAMQGE